MPRSKTKRKNGKTAQGGMKAQMRQAQRLGTAIKQGRVSQEEGKRLMDKLLWRRRAHTEIGAYNLTMLLNLQDDEKLLEAFTKAIVALDRQPTTTDRFDFRIVNTVLMFGFMCGRGVADQLEGWAEMRETLGFGLFRNFANLRLRLMKKPLPEVNLEPVRDAVILASDITRAVFEQGNRGVIMRAAEVSDSLWNLKHHKEWRELNDELLGTHADQIMQWEETDKLPQEGGLE